MKHLLASVAILVSTQAYGDTVNSQIQDHYRNETVSVPINVYECSNVDVPIYREQRNGASGGDVLAGMIIGGILGKGLTGDDSGAAAGAVMGGVVAADRGNSEQQIVGYRTERQCYDVVVYEEKRQSVYSHSTITFTVDGKRYTVEFKR